MPRKWLGTWTALVVMVGMSGCSSFCDKYCSHPASYAAPAPACCQPVVCQPVCCQPVATAPPPTTAQPAPTWQNPRTGYYYDPCACTP
jgi:hypothetical protein